MNCGVIALTYLRLPLLCEWEGQPMDIVFQYPYVILFDAQFIEIRHVDTVSSGIASQLYNANLVSFFRENWFRSYLEIKSD